MASIMGKLLSDISAGYDPIQILFNHSETGNRGNRGQTERSPLSGPLQNEPTGAAEDVSHEFLHGVEVLTGRVHGDGRGFVDTCHFELLLI